jgi:hypothetical protein
LKQLIAINTVAIIVAKPSNQLYPQRLYAKAPQIKRNAEYHNLVSPIVRIGGRSRRIHSCRIKSNITPTAPRIIHCAKDLRLKSAATKLTSPKAAATIANIGNMFHPALIVSALL